jgi:two-component system cell cycle response regulator
MRILFIEPSKTFQKIIDGELKSQDIEYDLVSTAAQAIEILSNQNFDLICMSLYLPDEIHGLDLCKQLRQSRTTELTPILLLTAEDDQELHNQAFKLGVTEIFHKQNIEGLLQYITHLYQQSSLYNKVSGKVLYVEDMQSQAEVVKTILQDTGFTVVHYLTAEAAFKDFCRSDYDLLVTDVILQGDMSGLGLVRAIRSTEGRKGMIPILALSGIEHDSRKMELLRSGVNDYVSKPVLPEEVVMRVKNLVRTKQLLDESEEHKTYLHTLAMTDRLTGLYNRHYLFDSMKKILTHTGRETPSISSIMMDVDHFKKINDTHGHQVGDLVLQQIAEVLKAEMREGDIAARFGGEEFLLILFECDQKAASEKADSFRQKIADLNPAGIAVTASFGVAFYEVQPDEIDPFESLLKGADRAVYAAKKQGRNQVVIHQFS